MTDPSIERDRGRNVQQARKKKREEKDYLDRHICMYTEAEKVVYMKNVWSGRESEGTNQ